MDNFHDKIATIDVELTRIEADINARKNALNGAVSSFPDIFKNDIKPIAKEIDKHPFTETGDVPVVVNGSVRNQRNLQNNNLTQL